MNPNLINFTTAILKMINEIFTITLVLSTDRVIYYKDGSGASGFNDWVNEFDQARQFWSKSSAIEIMQKLKKPYAKSEMFIEHYTKDINQKFEFYIPPGEIKR